MAVHLDVSDPSTNVMPVREMFPIEDFEACGQLLAEDRSLGKVRLRLSKIGEQALELAL